MQMANGWMRTPLIASENTFVFVKPLFTAVQSPPLLVDKNTPLSNDPAKMFAPSMANELI